jgi:putative two-component system hydrogenase maturation factor HypX/HoxX
MRILLLASAFNSLTQRIFVELDDVGHDVGCSVVADDRQMRTAVEAFGPDLVVAPYLKRAIPVDVWERCPCLIVHPGIRGDRGPSSLDWAILRGALWWGVTVLQATGELDAGDIWAHREFPMVVEQSKSALYRHEIADAAVDAVLEAIDRLAGGSSPPEPLDYRRPEIEGRLERPCRQEDRRIDWSAPSAVILRHLRCSDSTPGVLDSLFGRQYYLFGGREERLLRGRPGELLARRDGAICRATGDGAVWISHLKRAGTAERTFVKLPAVVALAAEPGEALHLPCVIDHALQSTYREIWYEEYDGVGSVHFDFYNGAMSTQQCIRLLEAYRRACRRPTNVIVLMGGSDLWCNGIDLNVIEASDEPSEESWSNINAMDDLVREILNTNSHVVVAALAGNAGAGGVPLALAADEVCARAGVVLNPHYKGMELSGSEYWTYLFPRRVGAEKTAELTETCLPISARRAKAIGLIDEVFQCDTASFREQVEHHAETIAHGDDFDDRIRRKRVSRRHDERIRPLDGYRYEELARMRHDFSGAGYARARSAFVHKIPLEPFTHPSAVGPVICGGGSHPLAAPGARRPTISTGGRP